jgi:DNA polymerase
MIGEQPGNDEDLAGRPFIGPAGRLLDRALEDAGLPRGQIYLTNAVKHFKFEERGKRRIHKKPSTAEVQACKPWLEAEVKLLHPRVIVCLGATAAAALFGNKFRLTKDRGKALDHPWAHSVLATIHPSAVLRIVDSDQRHTEYARLVTDLREAVKLSA